MRQHDEGRILMPGWIDGYGPEAERAARAALAASRHPEPDPARDEPDGVTVEGHLLLEDDGEA